MTKWTLEHPPVFGTGGLTGSRDELEEQIEIQATYIERLEQTIKNMTLHIRVDPDE